MASDVAYVLDSSVALCWFLEPDPRQLPARRVLRDLRVNPVRYLVPPLFYSEVIHALARGSKDDAVFVQNAIALLLRLGIRTISLTSDALHEASRLACGGLGGYDATYVALANSLGIGWLTADDRAARLARKTAVTLSKWSTGHAEK